MFLPVFDTDNVHFHIWVTSTPAKWVYQKLKTITQKFTANEIKVASFMILLQPPSHSALSWADVHRP